MHLLGCDRLNSAEPCSVNIRYSGGRGHVPGSTMRRMFPEHVGRGVIMSALRNIYLTHIYDHLTHNASLLLVLDPDMTWKDWDLDNIAQAAYYFSAKPQLQQLCAHVQDSYGLVDGCTLSFYRRADFGDWIESREITYESSLKSAPDSLPPVKVQSCFQAFAFYRLADLARQRLRYSHRHGEWLCEHNTLSRQLREVYIDPQLHLFVSSQNIG